MYLFLIDFILNLDININIAEICLDVRSVMLLARCIVRSYISSATISLFLFIENVNLLHALVKYMLFQFGI